LKSLKKGYIEGKKARKQVTKKYKSKKAYYNETTCKRKKAHNNDLQTQESELQ
jgi:hypothetical protein